MRQFTSIYLSLILPISALFITAATGYFLMNYDTSKALKLGVLSGFISAVLITLLVAVLLYILRMIHNSRTQEEDEFSVVMTASEKPINKTFILLMDKALAFEVAIHAIIDQNIGDVSKESRKKKGNITIFTPSQTIKLLISPLTKHTAEVNISADAYSKDVISIVQYIKEKEKAFITY